MESSLIVRERALDEAIKTLIEVAEVSRPGMIASVIASTGEVLSTTVRLKDVQTRGTLVKHRPDVLERSGATASPSS